MRKIFFILTILFITVVSIISCKKEFKQTAAVENISNSAFLRIVHASPSLRNLLIKKDSFNVFLDGVKLNSTVLTFGGTFPAATTNTYAAIPAGTKNIKLSYPGKINIDSITITSLTKTLTAGNYYTFLVTDSITSIKDSSQVWINDIFSTPAAGFYNLRFVHAVLNDTAGKAVDIYSTRRNGNIFTNILPGNITAFQSFAYNPQLNDTLYVRRSGTTINLAQRAQPSGMVASPGNQRSYTIYYKGDDTITVSNTARLRSLAFYLNH